MTNSKLRAAEAKFRQYDALREEALTARNAAIRDAVAEGRTKAEISRLLGLTQARVGQIVADR
jgi:DNA-binding NarL/FixJ family response regulator